MRQKELRFCPFFIPVTSILIMMLPCAVHAVPEEKSSLSSTPVADLAKKVSKREGGMDQGQETESHADVQMVLGHSYYFGINVPQDYQKAVFWLRKSAEQGNPHAQLTLSMAYYLGQSVPKNPAIAYMWISHASAATEKYVKLREGLKERMTEDELAKAKQLASRWKVGDPDPGRNAGH